MMEELFLKMDLALQSDGARCFSETNIPVL